MKPRSRPLSFEGEGWLGKRDVVIRNGRENSRPEKGRRKRRCVRFKIQGWFVCGCAFSGVVDLEPEVAEGGGVTGRVSGR